MNLEKLFHMFSGLNLTAFTAQTSDEKARPQNYKNS